MQFDEMFFTSLQTLKMACDGTADIDFFISAHSS